jgi:sporulation integral membrane protein YtvI
MEHPEVLERYAAFRVRFNQTVSDMIGNALAALSGELPTLAAKWISALPSALLFAAVTVIAGFYFCIDGHWGERAIALLPCDLKDRVPRWRTAVKRLSWRYVKAYLVLLLLTFSQLFLGFTILRLEYAFLLAFVISVVDILPVLGVGTVLVPWAVVALLQKNHRLGIGLLILYFAVTVIRQVLEPRLIGKSLGLHPLCTLLAGYAGWKLFGVLGMALGPIAALFLRNLWRGFGSASDSA